MPTSQPLPALAAARTPLVLAPDQWQTLAEGHRARIAAFTDPIVELHHRGEKHPVHDFLFSYYSLTPGALQRWHPGAGVVLARSAGEGTHPDQEIPDDGPATWRFYREVAPSDQAPQGGWEVDVEEFCERRASMVEFGRRILSATASRPARLACFGLHEWAMAYRAEVHGVRHSTVPLRLGAEGTNAVVEGSRITCSHIDAFRFFAPEAVELNELQPTRARQVELEQPGCLHANMDLYKWAYKLLPAISSDLVADCFELAWDIRGVDMQASPYDLADWGYEPIRIETAEGRAEYVRHQRAFAERAQELRGRLLAALDHLEALSGDPIKLP
ncbi:3-methyladenine DNA glycosylase [Micrococcus sp. IITD107]|uniref:3-methyladenine DNA glycosylase n=1 Tax=Micrococcus sp. IITD107 TaxID=3342790 RepID=UPI0035BA0201